MLVHRKVIIQHFIRLSQQLAGIYLSSWVERHVRVMCCYQGLITWTRCPVHWPQDYNVMLMMLPALWYIVSGFYEGEAARNTVVAAIQVNYVIDSFFAGLLDFKMWDLRFEISRIRITWGPWLFSFDANLCVLSQASDKDSGAYGSVWYSIVHEGTPGLFSLDNTTGDVTLSNLSDQVTGKSVFALTVSAVDNQGKVPSNRANQSASVLVSLWVLDGCCVLCISNS